MTADGAGLEREGLQDANQWIHHKGGSLAGFE